MLGFLLEKVDNMQQYMGNGSREVESQYRQDIRNEQKEITETKHTVMEVKNAFNGIINRQGMAWGGGGNK